MVKRLLVLIIVTSTAWLAGCQPADSSESVAPSDAVELSQESQSSQPPPAQTEHDTQSPPVTDASETTDAGPEETISSRTEPREDTTPKTKPAVELEDPPKADVAADSAQPAKLETDEEHTATESEPEPIVEAAIDSEKELPKEADTPDPVESETAKEQPAAKPEDKPKVDPTRDSAKEPPGEIAQETDFKTNAPDLYEKCKYILATYVDKYGNVDYKTLRRKRAKLIAATRAFDNIDPTEYKSWSPNGKIAFWINAYNILTLKLVVDNYPIKPVWYRITYPPNSIIHITGAWTKHYFNVMGIEYTLREIEREILMAGFKDPRICFTFSYATRGGALLRNEPYYPDKLDEQLDDQVKKFLATPRGLRIDHQEKTIRLADIFNWYKRDFIEKYGDIKKFRDRPAHIQAYLNCIVKYISSDDLKYVESRDYEVKFLKYDWRLNEQTNK